MLWGGSERPKVSAETYEIVVKGTLSPALVAAFDGFTVSRADHGLTHLVGWVPDQARLHGLLDLLRDLTIELVSVNPVSRNELSLPSRGGVTEGSSDG
jgi:hypothetical protein